MVNDRVNEAGHGPGLLIDPPARHLDQVARPREGRPGVAGGLELGRPGNEVPGVGTARWRGLTNGPGEFGIHGGGLCVASLFSQRDGPGSRARIARRPADRSHLGAQREGILISTDPAQLPMAGVERKGQNSGTLGMPVRYASGHLNGLFRKRCSGLRSVVQLLRVGEVAERLGQFVQVHRGLHLGEGAKSPNLLRQVEAIAPEQRDPRLSDGPFIHEQWPP